MPSASVPNDRERSEVRFLRRVLIVAGVIALGAALWALSDILLLVFGAVFVAVVLRALADPISRMFGLSQSWALAVAGVAMLALIAGVLWLFGSQIAAQLGTVVQQTQAALNAIMQELGIKEIKEVLGGSAIGNLAARALGWGTMLFGALASLVLVIAAGVFMAIDPKPYREGLLMLFPMSVQPRLRATLADAGEALRRWLAGQALAMVIVGAMTGVGLWLIGLPSALALGLIAGLTEFVPYIGPIMGAIPALLIASSQGTETMLWTLGVVIVVQQIENNLIMPLIASRTVAVPPAVGLFAVIALGVLFGPLGLLLGFPLAVVLDVAVRRLYVRETLGEPVDILAEDARREQSGG